MNTELNEFTQNDLQLLLHLQEDPLQTYSKIASNLGKSVKTVSRWISRLEKNKLFHPVRAIFNYSLLNLEVHDLILDIPSLKNVKKIESFVDNFPYSLYRVRLNGATNGLYIQFRSPLNTKSLYEDIINLMKKEDLIHNSHLFTSSEPTITTKFNLNYWDNNSMEWKFDWDEWEESMYERNIEKLPKIRKLKFIESLFQKLDKIDMFLLRLLNENAKMKLKEIENRLKKDLNITESLQRLSERVQFLKKNFVIDYRLYLNRKVLDIYNTLLLDITCSENIISRLKSQIFLNPPPFPGHFKSNLEKFLWYMSLPATHFSKISSLMWKQELKEYKVSFVDYSSVYSYYFWEEIYDQDNKSWKVDRNFIYNEPIKYLLD
ncbi:MAG: hypothetical protein HeimC3_49100 [Candidatus Heimdallarchaeota archaeon LC_3]|nr:MAG: hypothetical protein HeimC3_49100 [Candidatus Heimdallarchaeota archaeon LC_3]